ncbi:helix-turn-helix transcriptional regulator [Nocardia blacklockiae]|uniref:helix-turn-helix transcriptional regulator n=1 Tax=Nocardia blacklockiae TaxID=480036 RepID=UPI0018945BF6|nr:helix-turn-helix transcriptional regulator [Nocardia blacklockiae]MBF6174828.1 helix-turn-helix domain-containing protein [Nocardia blacklockiae]
MSAANRRRELGEFLRSRRERRRPEDLGLPSGGRRRTPGLRREEVAVLAGMSVTWYTWLEQGRQLRASRQVWNSLVDVLGLDEVETAHLFRLAGEMPPRVAESSSALGMDRYQAVLDQFDPNPALLISRRFDVVAWNRGVETLYGDLSQVPDARRNILWFTFTSADMRATADDWEAEAAQTVAFFRALTGHDVTAPGIAELIGELETESADFARLWRRKDLAARTSDSRVVHHPSLGRIEFEITKMRTLDGEHTLVTYLPRGGAELRR